VQGGQGAPQIQEEVELERAGYKEDDERAEYKEDDERAECKEDDKRARYKKKTSWSAPGTRRKRAGARWVQEEDELECARDEEDNKRARDEEDGERAGYKEDKERIKDKEDDERARYKKETTSTPGTRRKTSLPGAKRRTPRVDSRQTLEGLRESGPTLTHSATLADSPGSSRESSRLCTTFNLKQVSVKLVL
jgi:hypothetical protein